MATTPLSNGGVEGSNPSLSIRSIYMKAPECSWCGEILFDLNKKTEDGGSMFLCKYCNVYLSMGRDMTGWGNSIWEVNKDGFII